MILRTGFGRRNRKEHKEVAAPDAAGGGALWIRYGVQLVTYSAISAAHNRRHGNVGISQFI